MNRFRIPVIHVSGDFKTGKTDVAFVRELKAARDCFEVQVNIDSHGGHLTALNNMLDAVLQHPGRIVTRVTGCAHSAASALFCVGHERWMNADGVIGIHSASRAGNEDMPACRQISDILTDLYALRSGVDRRQVSIWLRNETYFDSKMALHHGFSTRIFVGALTSPRFKIPAGHEATTDHPLALRARQALDFFEFEQRRMDRRSRTAAKSEPPRRKRQMIELPAGTLEFLERAQSRAMGALKFGMRPGAAFGFVRGHEPWNNEHAQPQRGV